METLSDPLMKVFSRLKSANQNRELQIQIITGVTFPKIKKRENRKSRDIKTIEKNGKMKLQVRVPTMGTRDRIRSLLSDAPGNLEKSLD